MKIINVLLALALASVSTVGFGNTLHSLDKTHATKAFQGNTITTISLATLNNQLVPNAFTGYFNIDGKLTGQFSNAPDNGPQKDQGTWEVKNDGTLCTTWEHWNNHQPICVTVYELNNGLLVINKDTNKFETLILKNDIKTGNQLG